MARKSYKFEVSGIEYQATTFSGKNGMTRAARLIKLVGPAVGKALTSYDTKEGTVEADSLVLAVQTLIGNLESDKVVSLIEDLLESLEAWVDGKKVQADLDNYFAGEYGTLFHCLFHIVKENYTSFFGGSVSNLLNLIQKDTPPESN